MNTTRIELDEGHDSGMACVPLPITRVTPYQVDRGSTVALVAITGSIVRDFLPR